MLIRSQEKMALANYNAGLFLKISNPFNKGYDIKMQNEAGYLELGRYSTEEKALKVLDMIQEMYVAPGLSEMEQNPRGTTDGTIDGKAYCRTIFEMPQDSEVD